MHLWQLKFSIHSSDLDSMNNALLEKGIALSWNIPLNNEAPLEVEAVIPMTDDVSSAFLQKDIETHLSAFSLVLPKEAAFQKIENRNWLEENYKSFKPLTIGSFFIHGSHYEGPFPEDKIVLKLDASTAFGSGEHETTRGCLRVMEPLLKQRSFSRILDMGCGSGILSLAAVHLTRGSLVAVDVDPDSVSMTKKNAMNNNVRNIDTRCGDGYKTLKLSESFDMIVSNILAEPLITMAPDLVRHLRPGGIAILSGFLTHQAQDVINAHTRLGLHVLEKQNEEEWSVVALERRKP